MKIQSIHGLYQRIYSILLANNADAVVDAGTDKVLLFLHSAGKNACFNLFAFSIRNSETDGWIFMLIAHSKAPFIVGVAAGVIDNLIDTGIYSL